VCMISFVKAQDNAGMAPGSRAMYKAQNPAQDKTDIFEITGTSGATFTASNISDGTSNSYRHSLRITLALATKENKGGNINLVFYTEGESMPYAAASENGALNIYYPRSMYESIKEKLDQSVITKKRVQLKVIQKADGFREGTLIF